MGEVQKNRFAAHELYGDANRLLEQGQLVEAEALLRRALVLDEEQGPGDQEVIDDLTLLAHVLLKQGQLDEADRLVRRALAFEEQRAEEPGATIVIQLFLLVLIAEAQGKREEAEVFLQRMIACEAREPHAEDIDAIFAFHEDALDVVAQGRYVEAESLVWHTLVVHEQVLGKSHPYVVLYLNQLAEIYCLQEKYHLAVPLLLRILSVTKRVGSALPLLAATSLYQLTRFAIAQADVPWAGRLAELAYREAEETVGSDHVVAGMALTTKADILFLQGKKEEAEEIAKQAQALLMRSQTVGSLFQLRAEDELAQIYNDMGQHEKAELVARRVLREAKRHLVADHHLLMFFLHTLAAALAGQKRYQQAEILYQQALRIAEQFLEPTHSFMAKLLRDLIQVCLEQRRYAFAELMSKRLLGIREQSDDQDAFRLSLLYKQIGLLCIAQGKTEEGDWYLMRYSLCGQGDADSRSS